MSHKSAWENVGYIARKIKTGCVTIMINEGGIKKYYIANLSDLQDVLTGRKGSVSIKRKAK